MISPLGFTSKVPQHLWGGGGVLPYPGQKVCNQWAILARNSRENFSLRLFGNLKESVLKPFLMHLG
jgi:hypothetical protein